MPKILSTWFVNAPLDYMITQTGKVYLGLINWLVSVCKNVKNSICSLDSISHVICTLKSHDYVEVISVIFVQGFY